MVGVWILSVVLGLGSAQAQTEEPTAREHRKLTRAFRCDEDTVSLRYLDTEFVGYWTIRGWRVTGCGETFMAATGRTVTRASVFMDDLGVRRRAPLDLTCAAESVSYRYVDYMTRVASGCGGQMTYIVNSNRQWVANVAAAQPQLRGIEGGSLRD